MNRRDRGGGGVAIHQRGDRLSPVGVGNSAGNMHLPDGRGLGGGVWLTLGGLPRDWREMDVFRAMEKRYGKVNHVRRNPASDREALVQFVSDSDAKFVWAARTIELYDRNCAVELASSRGADVGRGRARDDSPPPIRGTAGAYSNPRMGASGAMRDFPMRGDNGHGMDMPPRRQMSNDRSRGDSSWNERRFNNNSSNNNNSNGGSNFNNNGNGQGNQSGSNQGGSILLPEEDDKATRTLFVGNLEYGINESTLRNTFSKYGMVQDIDIKRPMQGGGNAYAFVRFLILDMAYRAKCALQGTRIGNFPCKIGYGKTNPTTRVWVGNLNYPGTASDLDESRLFEEFDRFGPIKKIDYVRGEHYGYVSFESVSASMAAVTTMRGSQFKINGDRGVKKIRMRVDYAEADDPYLPKSKEGLVRRRRDSSKTKDSSGEKLERRRRTSDSKSPSPHRDLVKASLKRRRSSAEAESDGEERPPVERQQKRLPRDESVSPPPKSSSTKADTKRKPEVKRRVPVETLSEFRKQSDGVWKGSITLKSTAYPVVCHLLRGPIAWLNSVLAPGQELQITRRLRLEEDKLKDVTDKINSVESATMICFDVPGKAGSAGKPLKQLQDYLLEKQAAGVITAPQAVMYIFPVCAFASKIVTDDMPTLIMPSKAEDATDEDFGLLMVVTSNQDGGAANAD